MRPGTFVRKGAVPAADPGTRPGLYGQTLVSTGHPDLDRHLGGGLPLGSLLLLLDDGWSGHGTTLLRYFLAEGAACGQSLLLAATPCPLGGLSKFIPAQLKGKASEQDEAEGSKEREEFKLRIAWQYRRYIQGGGSATPQPPPTPGRGSSGSSTGGRDVMQGVRPTAAGGPSSSRAGQPASWRDWCHRFDLLRPAGGEALAGCRAELLDCGSGTNGTDGVAAVAGMQRLLSGATAFVQSLAQQQQQQQQEQQEPGVGTLPAGAAQLGSSRSAMPPRGPHLVGRLAVLSLGSADWRLGEGQAGGGAGGGSVAGGAAARALLQLKGLVRGARCAAMVSVPAALFGEADLARMLHLADGVVALESVADDSDIARLAPDPASVAGLLHLRKLPALGAAVPPLPEVPLHLVRHRRRRLAISPVEIDPEAELAEAEAASGAGRSVAAALCGGPPAASKAVDF